MELVGHYKAGRSRHIRVWRHEAGGYWWEMLQGKTPVGGGVGYTDTVDLSLEIAKELWCARAHHGVRYKPVVPMLSVTIAEVVVCEKWGKPTTSRRRQHA